MDNRARHKPEELASFESSLGLAFCPILAYKTGKECMTTREDAEVSSAGDTLMDKSVLITSRDRFNGLVYRIFGQKNALFQHGYRNQSHST